MIQVLETLNDKKKGISLNVGKISGGTTTNVIPDLATASFEYRFWDSEAEKQTLDRINDIVNYPENPMTGATVNCHHRRPAGCPMKKTSKLYKMVSETGRELGRRWEKRGEV